MKIRSGFVSNSSSSSFVIQKDKLTPAQIYMIQNHIEVAKKINEAVGINDKTDSYEAGMRRKGAYRDVPKTAEEIEQERKDHEPCDHPEVVECSRCNFEPDPIKEVWDDNIIVGGYYVGEYDAWDVEETEKEIRLYTTMNNFDMEVFLKEIGVPEDAMKEREY